ncbi:HIRA-interacting protein 3 isoform X5 [Saccopteryx leptura]|uniref:HIRA-interacting protein 3 isoform X5 n=1 Tax=Saccopteryx leptura TaxID=249018 RepID=UPI00339BB7DA
MARENEMRKFTRSFFRGRPDLSTLTHSIVRRRFLSHTGRDHLDPEEKQTLKRLVEKELVKMQMGEAGARQEGLDLVKRAKRPATPCSDSERKRFRLNSESECSDAASSPDYFSPPAKNGMVAAVSPAEERRKRASREAAESSDEGEQWRDLTAQTGLEKEAVKGSCEEEEAEEEKGSAVSKIWKEKSSEEEEDVEKKSKGRTRKKPVTRDKTQWKGGERQSGSGKGGGEDSRRKMKTATKGTGESAEVESRKTANSEAGDSEREVSDSEAGGTPTGKRKNHSRRKSSKTSRTRSSSSSSASGSPAPKDRKAGHRRHHRGEDHPAVSRLKRYIWACGARRNYKKLLGSCRSHKERLCVLRAELEALGMKGNPSLEKCRALKEQREEAAEVASLDITNIISCSGRPRRCTAWNPSEVAPPGELYRRTLDSEEECHHPPRPDWSHMRGIISSDGESN